LRWAHTITRHLPGTDSTGSPPGGPGSDPLGTIPLFDVSIPLTPARAAAIRRALASLDVIRTQRHDLDQREHQPITAARDAGPPASRSPPGSAYKDRQAAQQRRRALGRILARQFL
jgi:hypothetical protein